MQNIPLPSSANQAVINNAAATAAATKKSSQPVNGETSEFQRMLAKQAKREASEAAQHQNASEQAVQRQRQQLIVKPGESQGASDTLPLDINPVAEATAAEDDIGIDVDVAVFDQKSEEENLVLQQAMTQVMPPVKENAEMVSVVPVTPEAKKQPVTADIPEEEPGLNSKRDLLFDKDAIKKELIGKAEAGVPFEKAAKTVPESQLVAAPVLDHAQDGDQFADALARVNVQAPALANPVTQAITPQSQAGAVDMRSTQIAVPFGQAGWNQAIGQKVVWMAAGGEQTASLTLNPPDLGPLQVVIHVHNNQADTTFLSDQADVRRALEDGMANLRDMMSQSGLQLGQANVRSGQQDARQQQGSGASAASATDTGNDSNQVMANAAKVMGLVDTFA